jgi:hypothetical protein
MVISPENWKCYDGCPMCKLLKKAAEKGREISLKRVGKSFQ